jgi:PiT family inorganic phosphate transporter
MDAGAAGQLGLGVVIALVLVALAFDFMNGFHDAANSIATVVSTRVLKPYQAVLMAAFFNFAALFVFQLKVATTIGRGIVDQGVVDHHLVFGALVGAIVWNLVTWVYGLPSSSSHALIGGLVGAAVAKAGTWALIPAGILKVCAFILIAPLMGMVLGALLMLAVSWLFVRATPSRVDRWFRRMQLVSASLYSLGHGGNDAQKTIGIIWMLLIAAGYLGSPRLHLCVPGSGPADGYGRGANVGAAARLVPVWRPGRTDRRGAAHPGGFPGHPAPGAPGRAGRRRRSLLRT